MADKMYESITTKNTLNKVQQKKMPFQWSINPYRGCAHGCSFCYARAFQGFLGLSAYDEFQHRILLKTNAAEALDSQLSKLLRKHKGNLDAFIRHVGLVAIGTATDPYQPVEGKALITRQCLQVLAKYRIPVTITTRSPLILRDLDLLTNMNVESIHISLNTLHGDIVRKLEPATPSPMKRLEALMKIRESGINAGLFIAPILPFITDAPKDMESLLRMAKHYRAAYAMPSLLRLSSEVKVWFFRTLEEQFPDFVAKYAKLYPSAYADRSYSEPFLKYIQDLIAKYELTRSVPEAEFSIQAAPAPVPPNRCEPKLIPEQLAFPF